MTLDSMMKDEHSCRAVGNCRYRWAARGPRHCGGGRLAHRHASPARCRDARGSARQRRRAGVLQRRHISDRSHHRHRSGAASQEPARRASARDDPQLRPRRRADRVLRASAALQDRHAHRACRSTFRPAASRAATGQSGGGAPSIGRAAIVVEKLIADDAVLALIPRKAGKSPRVFADPSPDDGFARRRNPDAVRSDDHEPASEGAGPDEGLVRPVAERRSGRLAAVGPLHLRRRGSLDGQGHRREADVDGRVRRAARSDRRERGNPHPGFPPEGERQPGPPRKRNSWRSWTAPTAIPI